MTAKNSLKFEWLLGGNRTCGYINTKLNSAHPPRVIETYITSRASHRTTLVLLIIILLLLLLLL